MAPSNAPAPIFIMLLKRLLALAFLDRASGLVKSDFHKALILASSACISLRSNSLRRRISFSELYSMISSYSIISLKI